MKVSCIIPAYNEQGRIGKVLEIAIDHNLIGETIVINDGSTDKTLTEIKQFDIKLINHKINRGKAKSMLDGCLKAKNDLVLFLDADLKGLNKKNITDLIEPVNDNIVDMTMSMRGNTIFLVKLFLGNDFLTGERVLKKDLAIKILQNCEGYCAEVMINKHILENKMRFMIIYWKNVNYISKSKKDNIIKGMVKEIKMFNEIIDEVKTHNFLKQLFVMGFMSDKLKKELR